MNRKLFYILLSLACLRIIMIVGFFCGVPYVSHEGWEFHQGGDQIEYFRVADSIVNADIERSKVAIGFPLYLAAFIAVFSADEWTDLVAPVLIVNCVFALVTIFLVGILANRLTGSTWAAAISALIWTLHPYILYAVFSFHQNAAILRNVYVSHSMWFPMLSDPISAFLFILGLTFFYSSLQKPYCTYLCAVATGLASMIRTLNLSEVIILCIFYFILRKHKQGIILVICVLVILIPQFIYNQYCSGNPFAVGYTPETEGQEEIFSFGYLFSFAGSVFAKYTMASIILLLLSITPPVFIILLEKRRESS